MVNVNSRAFYSAVTDGDVSAARALLQKYPELKEVRPLSNTWLHVAAGCPSIEMIALFLELGFDVNCLDDVEETALAQAVADGQLEVAKFLIERGANPNIGRPLIAAINQEDCPYAMVKLLVDNGININQVFHWFDDPDQPFTALSHAIASDNGQIVKYLRSQGAALPQ
jgi:ankyrin repeat protein